MDPRATVCESCYSDQFKTGVFTMFLVTDNILFRLGIVLI